MKITQFRILIPEIPFKVTFKHASAVRAKTQTLLVLASSDKGHIGWGEGCPREYVTNENLATGIRFLKSIEPQIKALTNLEEIMQWVNSHQPLIDKNPAAWCAMELALLDLLGREEGRSLEDLLGLYRTKGEFRYSAVLGDSGKAVFETQVDKYIAMGFQDFKIKLSGDLEKDRQKLETVFRRTGYVRMRLDANNLWTSVSEAVAYFSALPKGFFGIEEPLSPFDFGGMETIHAATGRRIILDESALRPKHLQRIAHNPSAYILNIRISKIGGVFRALEMVRLAKKMGLPMIIGAQVGETSILTRAAWAVAGEAGDYLLAQEGAFGTLLLERDVVTTPLMFGPGGELRSEDYLNPSLGGLQLEYRAESEVMINKSEWHLPNMAPLA